jgi:hypothetical protein
MDDRSRYRVVSRRKLLQGSAGFGLAAVLSACGTNDAEVFAGSEVTAQTSASGPTTTTTPPVTESTIVTEPAESTASSVAVAELAIAFTYDFGNGGKKLNPFIAVWIEDAEGILLRTSALWFKQTQKGPRWLPDLKRWFVVDEADSGVDAIETVSSATRQPGSYNVVWDGLDDVGEPVAGTVFVCIESSRERGPYSLIRESYDLASTGTTRLDDDGELSEASVTSV